MLHVHITLACARVPDCDQHAPNAEVAMPPATRSCEPLEQLNNVGPSVETLLIPPSDDV